MSTLNGVFTYDKMIYMKQKMDALYSQFSGNYNDLTNKPTSVSDFSNDSGFQTEAQVEALIGSATELLATTAWVTTQLSTKVSAVAGKDLSSNDFTDTLLAKLNAIAAGAEVNVNANWDATSGDAQILNKPTAVSDFTNDSGFQTAAQVTSAISSATGSFATTTQLNNAVNGLASEDYVDGKVSSAYKASGSVAFASLPTLTSATVGNVYNVTNSFVTTADFAEGAGVSYGAGTNVAIVEISGVKKYDALAGLVDLSNYMQSSDITEVTNTQIDALFA